MFDMLTSPYTHPLKRLIWMRLKAGARAVWDTITGNPVSFTAKAAPLRQLEVAFSPVQDLNGYDAPWPAGGGVNRYDYDNSGIVLQNLSLTGRTYTNTATDTRDYFAFGALAYNGSTLIPDSVTTINVRKTGRAQLQITINSECTKIRLRHSGASTNLNIDYPWTRQGTFTISIDVLGYDASTVGGLSFKDVVIADGDVTVTTYSPYSNECPISGWSSLTVEQRGKNLFDQTDLSMVTCYLNTTEQIRRGKRLDLPAGTYTISAYNVTGESAYIYIDIMNADGSVKQFEYWIGGTAIDRTRTFTLAQGEYFIIFDQQAGEESSPNKFENFNFILELGSTTSTYVPYNPSSRSISISLGETVYSGYVDVVTGVGEVTMAKIVLDGTQTQMGQENWRPSATSVGFYYNFPIGSLNVEFPATTDTKTSGISDTLSAASYNDVYYSRQGYDNAFALMEASGIYDRLLVRIADTTLTTWTLINAYLTQNPITIVYPLATPIPIQLTPQEVESLAGDNVLFSDANGDLTVEYRSN